MAVSQKDIFDLEGIPIAKDAFIVIVKTAWNSKFVNRLQEGCEKILNNKKVRYQIMEVPGAVEIPFAIQYQWNSKKEKGSGLPDAYIALGCVIKGDTPHFEYVCQSVTQGITNLNLSISAPVIYGVLTLLDTVQAEERLGGAHGHKGEEAAATALKMIALKKEIDSKI